MPDPVFRAVALPVIPIDIDRDVQEYLRELHRAITAALQGEFIVSGRLVAVGIYVRGPGDTNVRIDGPATGNPYIYFMQFGVGKAYIQYIDTGDYLRYDAPKHHFTGGDVDTDGSYKVDNVQVVSNRVVDERCDDAVNSGDATTDGVIDALRDAMITHGLIAAS